MANIVEDVLVMIFRIYLEEPSTMPTSLIPVCKRWRDVLKANPSLWFRVAIIVRDINTIPSILSSTGFHNYLSMTDELDGVDSIIPVGAQISRRRLDILLDIEITLCEPLEDKSYIAGGETHSRIVAALNERQEQLNSLFAVLAGIDTVTFGKQYWPTNDGYHQIHRTPSRSRICRWQSFLFQSTSYKQEPTPMEPSVPNLLQDPEYIALRLRKLFLRKLPSYYVPHENFGPNLKSVTLEEPDWAIDGPSYFKQILTFENGGYSGYTPSYRLADCPVEELSIKQASKYVWLGPYTKFSSLKSLEFEGELDYPLLRYMSKQFEDSSRRLELVHFINTVPFLIVGNADLMGKISILTKSKKIIFTMRCKCPYATGDHSCNQDNHNDAKSDWLSLAKFLAYCDPDTEIVGSDETSMRILAIAEEIGWKRE